MMPKQRFLKYCSDQYFTNHHFKTVSTGRNDPQQPLIFRIKDLKNKNWNTGANVCLVVIILIFLVNLFELIFLVTRHTSWSLKMSYNGNLRLLQLLAATLVL